MPKFAFTTTRTTEPMTITINTQTNTLTKPDVLAYAFRLGMRFAAFREAQRLELTGLATIAADHEIITCQEDADELTDAFHRGMDA